MSDKYITMDDVHRYRELFKAPPPIDVFGMFDVFKFDNILHDHFDYDEDKDGSIRDFLTAKYSAETADFVEGLIFKPLGPDLFLNKEES